MWSELGVFLIPLALLMLVALAGLMYFNRRRMLFPRHGPLSIEQVLSIGPRERIIVLKTKSELLVVGVTSEQITLLTRLDPQFLADTSDHSSEDTSH